MPKAYSYLRFSRPEQMKGDSYRRQTEGSRDYAKRHGLELDETLKFSDKGVSAFRGKNAQVGALAAFLDAVEAGKIRKGSYLLVENLDRLSRQTVGTAFTQFNNILARGVNIVTLTDGKLYTAATLTENFGDLMVSLTTMFRAHEESATKSKRLSAAWETKRKKAQAKERKLTARCPAWLTLASDRKAFLVNSDRKKVVRQIFDMTLAGHGKSVITRRLNEEGVPTFGKSKGWHPSYVQKILENEAVCGVFQPMKFPTEQEKQKGEKRKRVPDGASIPDYFPVVIDRATFERASKSRKARRIPTGRKGENFSNLFSGFAVCANCGAAMHYVNKGEGSKGGSYLVCSNARRAASNCKAPSWRYDPAQALLLLCIETLDYAGLFPDLARDTRAKLRELEDRKLEMESERDGAERELDNLATLLVRNPNQPTLEKRLNTTQAAFDRLSLSLTAIAAQIEEERERAKNAESDFRQVQDGLERLDKAHKTPGADLYDLRSRLHQLLKRTVSTIAFHPDAGTDFAPKKPGDWRGRVEIGFQGARNARTLYVAKDYRECRSVPVRDGKPDFKKAVTLKMREA